MPILSQESDCKSLRKNPQCIQEISSQRSQCKFCERLQSNRKINEVRIHPPTWLLHRHHTQVTTSANIRGSKQPSTTIATLGQRQLRAKILVANRHPPDDIVWPESLPAPRRLALEGQNQHRSVNHPAAAEQIR